MNTPRSKTNPNIAELDYHEIKVVLVKDFQYRGLVVEVVILNFFDLEIVVDIIFDMDLFLAGDVQFFHHAGARHFHIVLDLLVDLTNNILEYILVGHPEIKEKHHRHDDVSRHKTKQIVCYIASATVFVTSLKFDDLKNVHDQEYQRDNAVIDHELGERAS